MRRVLVVLPFVMACGDDTGPPDARAIDGPPAGGTISLSWTIADDGTPLTCAQIGVASVSLTMIKEGEIVGTTDTLACAAGMGAVAVPSPGTWDVTVTLAGITAEAVRFDNVVVESGQDTPMGEAAFQVDAVGGFAFRIGVPGNQGNCTEPAQGGAGIDEMELVVSAVGGGCVEVTFDIAAGATQPASTYTTSCATPGRTACIAQDQQITVAPTLATGPYQMEIRGYEAGAACWSRLSQFDVPAGGDTENLPQQVLTFNDQVPGCTAP